MRLCGGCHYYVPSTWPAPAHLWSSSLSHLFWDLFLLLPPTHPHPDLNEWSILSAATELADSCVTELPHCIVIILDNVWASWGQTSCFIHLCIPFTSSLANTWCIFGGWPAGWLAWWMNGWMNEWWLGTYPLHISAFLENLFWLWQPNWLHNFFWHHYITSPYLQHT